LRLLWGADWSPQPQLRNGWATYVTDLNAVSPRASMNKPNAKRSPQ
jgi:hypothetical protein